MTVSRLLIKAKALYRQALAAQPVDPLAELTADERKFYIGWFARFKAANSQKPDALYAAMINRNGWTPSSVLQTARITTEMTLQDCADLYRDQLGKS